MHPTARFVVVLALAALAPITAMIWQLAGPTPTLLGIGAALTGSVAGAGALHLVYRRNISALSV